jgi:sulfate/thiosulfate transport system substrate-binding protein
MKLTKLVNIVQKTMKGEPMRRRATAGIVALLAVASLALAACGGSSESSGDGNELSLVAYSTPREAYEELTSLFRETEEGEDVSFAESYGSSGEQTRAVIAGLDADVVALSLAPDLDKLVESGLVAADWTSQPHKGMVTNSVVVLVTRPGNPKGIEDWDDLLAPGVEVVTPNPFTSGGARWNIMAAYGAWRKAGKTDAQAQDNLLALFRNVVVQDKSARDSLNTFLSGKGDVLLAYENEAIFSRLQGEDLPFVVPSATILIENPVAALEESDAKEKAEAFLQYLWTPEAQQVFADNGYRPVVESVLEQNRDELPVVPGQFTIEDVGGWPEVMDKFFDPRTGIMAEIERAVGGSTG